MTTPESEMTPETMTFEAMIGLRIAKRREHAGLSQRKLGELVERFLDRKLHRQSISVLEQGGRSPTAAELVALAEVLETTVGYFLFPPTGVKTIEAPNGRLLSREEVERQVVDPEARNVLPAATARLRKLGVWLNELAASTTIELRELRSDYESIALGAKALPDDGLRAREQYHQELTDRLPRLRGEPEPEGGND